MGERTHARRSAIGFQPACRFAGGHAERIRAGTTGEPFYKGKTLRLIISVGVAGGFGEYARSLAEHIGRHIPGHPHVIVQSMPGAGGLIATNHLYVQAPQDGTVVAMVNATAPLAPLWGSGARASRR